MPKIRSCGSRKLDHGEFSRRKGGIAGRGPQLSRGGDKKCHLLTGSASAFEELSDFGSKIRRMGQVGDGGVAVRTRYLSTRQKRE